MSYFDDAKALIEASKLTLSEIRTDYESSLHEQVIKKPLLIKIKNFMENLRSALDYSAHGLFEKYGDNSRANSHIYFPYAWSGLSLDEFRRKRIVDNKIPGLLTNRPDIAAIFESYQHFSNLNNSWLPLFMDLNNNNKHQKLTPQVRKEFKQLSITHNSGMGIVLVSGGQINIGEGAEIRMGNSTLKGSQIISPDTPAKVTSGELTQEVTIWVSFIFEDNNEPVYPFLEKALSEIEKIVEELASV